MKPTSTEIIHFSVPVRVTAYNGRRRAAIAEARRLMRDLPSIVGTDCDIKPLASVKLIEPLPPVKDVTLPYRPRKGDRVRVKRDSLSVWKNDTGTVISTDRKTETASVYLHSMGAGVRTFWYDQLEPLPKAKKAGRPGHAELYRRCLKACPNFSKLTFDAQTQVRDKVMKQHFPGLKRATDKQKAKLIREIDARQPKSL